MQRLRRFVAFSVLAATALTCNGEMSPSPVNLTGTWSGMLGQSGTGSALRVTWIATQTGMTVSGPATMVKPSLNVPATGTMTGTLSGSQLTLTYAVPAGAVPVYLSCMVTASGSATATSQSISGNLDTTFTFCLGSGLERPDSTQLTLTKSGG